MIQYGLISRVDSDCIEKTLDLLFNQFPDEAINYCEIGLYNGRTTSGVKEYFKSKDKKYSITGIDNFKDKEELVFYPEDAKLIQGSSIEVYNQIEDNSQHLILEDSCHCFACVCSTFFCYAPKVKAGGYFAFHDTGKHIRPFKDFQHGDKNNPDAYISCRKSLNAIGLYNNLLPNWELIFDESDSLDEAGGISVFKRLS